ncbi:unnamed protein product, partial [Effrenium voratum]
VTGHTDAVQAALSLPQEDVSWYIYCSITHAYSDGLSGQALFADLLRFYAEELGQAERRPSTAPPEQLALLQRRLRRSLRKHECNEPNEDLYHESICDDWGKREGWSRRIYFHPNVAQTLRFAAGEMHCSVDLAWLSAVMCSMFRLFPDQPRMHLVLKAACRDGPGQGQMVGFLSEARVLTIDPGELSGATMLDVHHRIHSARLARDWRAPLPFE